MAYSNTLPRSAPELQGISSTTIQTFVKTIEQNIQHLHSFMLLRHGTIVAESWWYPYQSTLPHMLFSLSKSFTSTAVGLAVEEGRLTVNDPILKFFPEDAPKKISKNLAAMQVRHLLSMSTGHHQDSTDRTMSGRNPFKAFLTMPVKHIPGTYFVYNSGASYMLAAIVQKLTGQTLIEYLTPRLLEPLGIEGAIWDSHPNGVNFGGWGLNIKTEDIARFGQLYLQKGVWNDRQLIPAAWVQAATSKQVSNDPNEKPDWEQGYGYQFWRCQPPEMYRGDGAFGQYCIVMPQQDAVLAITSGVPDMQAVLTIAYEKLLPGMKPDPLPADIAAAAELAQTLKNAQLIPPQVNATSPEAERISGKTISFEPNPETLRSLSFNFKNNTLTYQLSAGGVRRGKHTITFGNGDWVEGLSALGTPGFRKSVARGTWTARDTFVLTLCQYETPYILTLTCRFEENQCHFDFKINVSFGPTEYLQLIGKIA